MSRDDLAARQLNIGEKTLIALDQAAFGEGRELHAGDLASIELNRQTKKPARGARGLLHFLGRFKKRRLGRRLADQATVGAAHGDNRRTRHTLAAIGPMAVAALAGVLNADKHGAAI